MSSPPWDRVARRYGIVLHDGDWIRLRDSHDALLAALKALVACCTDSEGAISPEPHDRGEWLRGMVAAKTAIAAAESGEEISHG